jgi:carboxylesterase type B
MSSLFSGVSVISWKVFSNLIILCILILNISEAFYLEKVRTENGWVAGERRGNYHAFEGLRYAAPPHGENRFKPPQPYTECWKGVRNFTKFGPACLQWDSLVSGPDKLVGDEDCLFMNVYTPVKKPYKGYKFPVIVNIHGGGFRFGDASFYGHELIMRRGNFVFASFNFRIGVLGFLSTESSVVSGNMGLKDQVMALKWVQRNIAAFDGDVDSITLTGFATGAASVHLHYMSPLSAGLFHRGVSHSGTATVPWILDKNPLEKTLFLAERMGCTNPDQQHMVNCLRSKPAADLVRTVSTVNEVIGSLFSHPFLTYAAVVEEEHNEAFITMTPREYLKQGRIQKLPWLASTVKDPGVFLTADLNSDKTIDKVNSNFTYYVALLADINAVDPETQKLVTSCLKRNFFGCQPLSKENLNQLTEVSFHISNTIH